MLRLFRIAWRMPFRVWECEGYRSKKGRCCRSILTSGLLLFAFITNAQTIKSNQLSRSSGIYEQIDFYDDDNNSIVSLTPRFYKQPKVKKWSKPIKVGNENYVIKRNSRLGVQSVYNESGENVANITSDGTKIHLVQDGGMYTLKPKLKLANLNILKCENADGTLISTISFKNDRRLVFENSGETNPNLLLLSLCAHQYQELLLGNRGRLSALNSALLLGAVTSILP